MKNLKRIFSLALAGTMLAGMLTIGASAVDFTDAGDINNKDAVNTLVSLGVIDGNPDGSYDPERIVTRAEMAKMITVALNGGKDFKYGTKATPTYTDIKGTWAESYIEYCSSLNIIAGNGDGTFTPTAPVTASAAAKMLLVAIGYDAMEEGMSGTVDWEINTNRLAGQKNFYEDLDLVVSEGLTRDNAAQMIYNAVGATMVKYDYKLVTGTDGQLGTKGVAEDATYGVVTAGVTRAYPETLLHKYFNVTTQEGYLNKISYNSTKGEYTYTVLNDDQTITTAGTTSNSVSVASKDDYTGFYGDKVRMLVKDAGTNNVSLYGIFSISDTVETALWGDVNPTTTDKTVKVNDTKYNLEVATVAALPVYVGNDISASANQKNGSATITPASTAKFVDVDGNGKIDYVVVTEATVGKVTFVNSTNATIGNNSYNLKDDVESVYDDMKKDDYAVVTLNDFTGKNIIEKAEVITGKIAANKNTNDVQVDGVWYKKAGNDALTAANIGSTYELAVVGNFYYAAKITAESGISNNILYISAADENATTLGTTTVKAKAHFVDGSTKTITVAKVDDNSISAERDDLGNNAVTDFGTNYTGNKVTVGAMYRYSTNSDGNYILYHLAGTNDVTKAGYEIYEGKTAATEGFDASEDKFVVNSTNFTIADDAVFFVQTTKVNGSTDDPADTSFRDVKVVSGKTMKTWNSATDVMGAAQVLANTVNGFKTVRVGALISKDHTAISGNASANYGYITSTTYIHDNEDGDKAIVATVWTADGEKEIEITTKTTTGTGVADTDLATFKKGAFITWENDNDGYAVKAQTFGAAHAVSALSADGKTLELKDGGSAAKAAKVDNDTIFIYINSADVAGVEGGALQMANETPVTGWFVNNVHTDADNGTLKVVFVDITNNLNGKAVEKKAAASTVITAADMDAKTATVASGAQADTTIADVANMFDNVMTSRVYDASANAYITNTTALATGDLLELVGTNGTVITLTITVSA